MDGTPVPPIVVQNVDPLVNALNAEALAGQPVPLIARFADPCWMDTHTADWSVGGQSPAATLEEDDLPAYETGIVTGVMTAGSTASGNVVVHDNDGGAGGDSFCITVVPNDQSRYEPNNTLAGAPVLEAEGSYLSYIQSPGDVDLFKIRMPGGGALQAGAEVLLTLRDLAADYDLAVVAVSPSPAGDPGESGQTSLNTTPFARSPFARNLTDDYYVDAAPTAWQGRELYVPDIPIARLVETPDEIRAAAQAFVASNGVLNPSSGFVSGYDFFADGGQEMADSLAAKLPTTTLINDTSPRRSCAVLGSAFRSADSAGARRPPSPASTRISRTTGRFRRKGSTH